MITCIVTTVIILASPAEKNNTQLPDSGGSSYEKKTEAEQAKKNYILRRFISYYPARQALY
ncbi:MAG: hypothetical protein ABJA79_11245 [Parafilimonas sp.]